MNQTSLEQRRSWFRFFPDGNLEFVVVTRVFVLLLMLLMVIVKGAQRPSALLALYGMLWLDYMLTLFWSVQIGTDLNGLAENPPLSAAEAAGRRLRALLVIALPATLAFAMAALWQAGLLSPRTNQVIANRIALPLLALAFLASLIPASRRARSLRLGPTLWTCATLIPLVHWLGIHRLLGHLDRRMSSLSPQKAPQSPGPGLAAAAADVLWFVTILPWVLMVAVAIVRGAGATEAMPYKMVPACGAILFALFSVVDLAAMENVQRQFVRLLRSL